MPLNGAGQISRQRGKHAYHGQQGSCFWADLSLKALVFEIITYFQSIITYILQFANERCVLDADISLHEPKNVMQHVKRK